MKQILTHTKKPLCPAGRTLAHWLNENHQTPRTLAIKIDVDQSLVYGWSWGRSVPSLRNAVRLSEVTGIPVTTWVQEGLPQDNSPP